ncbi:glycosyltransferase [Paraburkholderia mimosarum]|uniref:glycosyltransferase n=1 Tax=Paraburkholderia mimosarum TaxID=312026 RepID=UPI0007C5CFB1|nr:glycosyltransferase [Paraburkholderia mimosarum]
MGLQILHAIITVNPTYGGPIEGIVQTSREHRRRGNSVEILSLDDPDDRLLVQCEFVCHAVGPGLGKYRYSPRLVPWLRANASKFDFIIVNGIWNYTSFGVWRALHGSGIPYYVFTHGMLDPYFKKHYPLKHLKKMLYWPCAEYRVLRDANAVFFTCEEERLLARQSFHPYRCNEHVVNYGTAGAVGDPQMQRELFLSKFPHLRGKRNLLFLGRIHEKKGIDLTLKALAQCVKDAPKDKVNDVQLIIAGPDNGEYASALKALCYELQLTERVTWAGMLGNDLKWGAFFVSDAFVLNSHQENFGVSVAEALSAALPTLITDKVNIWREIEEAGAGFVDTDDLAGAVRLLRRWLGASRAEWADIRTRARECFTSRFHIALSTQSLLDGLAMYAGNEAQAHALRRDSAGTVRRPPLGNQAAVGAASKSSGHPAQ